MEESAASSTMSARLSAGSKNRVRTGGERQALMSQGVVQRQTAWEREEPVIRDGYKTNRQGPQ